jgi:hypothetical protein
MQNRERGFLTSKNIRHKILATISQKITLLFIGFSSVLKTHSLSESSKMPTNPRKTNETSINRVQQCFSSSPRSPPWPPLSLILSPTSQNYSEDRDLPSSRKALLLACIKKALIIIDGVEGIEDDSEQ